MKKKRYIVYIYELSIYPFHLFLEVVAFKFPQFISLQGRAVTAEWRNRFFRASGDLNLLKKLAGRTLNIVKRDPGWAKRVIDNYYLYMDQLVDFLGGVYKTDLRRKTNKELWKYFDEFRDKYQKMYLFGWLPNALEGFVGCFSKYLQTYLRKKLKKINKESLLGEYFSALVTSARAIPREAGQRDFLKIVKKIYKNKKLKLLFKKQTLEDIDRALSKNYLAINWLIERHHKRFAWLLFKYEGPAWDRIYILGLIKDFLIRKCNPDKELARVDESKKEIKQKQKEYAQEIGLSKDQEMKFLFDLAQQLCYFKEHQKDYLFQCYFYLDKLVSEASSRLALSPRQFRHFLHQEIKQALLENKYNTGILNERIKHSVLVIKEDGSIKLVIGKRANKIAKKAFSPLRKAKVFKGQCANSGYVKGEVKIIQETQDIKNMKEGAILVTTRTNPNLLPAMRKASAIVADIGGINSHAAIISRELKIPCVVGTKMASMILKDGDKIEVDAERGVVRKIK